MQTRLFDSNSTFSFLGFGAMRLPRKPDGSIDRPAGYEMVRRAVAGGINYFDTAYPYHDGDSETFIGEALAEFPRERYHLADKMPVWCAKKPEDMPRIFDEQLKKCRTDYFDCYLLHSVTADNYRKAKELGAIDYLLDEKKRGRIKRLGFSFHDDYALFEEVLRAYPWDFCQLQFNYMDVDEQAGLKGIELTEELGVPVIVMEPLKGGKLSSLPDDVQAVLSKVNATQSPASWAFRFLYSYPSVRLVLSGMSSLAQLEENLRIFASLSPLDENELKALGEARRLFLQRQRNGCTNCRYCMPCPFGVDIPGNFAVWNDYALYGQKEDCVKAYFAKDWDSRRASNCRNCGHCVTLCPQNIPIPEDLSLQHREFSALVDPS